MDILVACHNEVEDAPLFLYQPPLFDTATPVIADYVDPYRSGRRWKDFPAESKDVIWDQYCPIMWPFSKVPDYIYHDSIFYNLFDDGWKILKHGGMIVIPFPKEFRSSRDFHVNHWPVTNTATALNNFKWVLKRLLSKHPWATHIVKRESMPFIIAERYDQEEYDEFILFTKPVVVGGKPKRRKTRRRRRI